MIRKAMVLAAGRGQRLRPLTDRIPKPLITVQGQSLIERIMHSLSSSGVHEVAVNLHHLGDQIQSHLGDGSRFGLQIRYYWETELLGTGGALVNARDFFQSDDFYLLNSDVLTDLSLPEVERLHRKAGGISTMVCHGHARVPDPPEVVISNDGRVISVRDIPAATLDMPSKRFMGIQLLTSEVFGFLPKGPGSIIQGFYQPALLAGALISAYLHEGLWEDIGTPESYERLTGNRLETAHQ